MKACRQLRFLFPDSLACVKLTKTTKTNSMDARIFACIHESTNVSQNAWKSQKTSSGIGPHLSLCLGRDFLLLIAVCARLWPTVLWDSLFSISHITTVEPWGYRCILQWPASSGFWGPDLNFLSVVFCLCFCYRGNDSLINQLESTPLFCFLNHMFTVKLYYYLTLTSNVREKNICEYMWFKTDMSW